MKDSALIKHQRLVYLVVISSRDADRADYLKLFLLMEPITLNRLQIQWNAGNAKTKLRFSINRKSPANLAVLQFQTANNAIKIR